MKKLIALVLVIIMVLFFAVHEQSENTIIIYSALEQYRNDDLTEQLRERFPDRNIQVMYLPTAKVAAKIRSEQTRSEADILLGVETGYLEMILDSLAEVDGYSSLDYIDGISPEHGKYVIWESYGGGFAVNTDILEKYGLEEPTSYDDLLKPEYRNLIATQDPKSSSTGYNFLLNRINTLGLEEAIAYYDALNENVKQYSESSSGPVKMLIQGEVAVCTALTYQVVSEINKGNPLKMIYPEEGSPYSLDGLTMLRGRKQDPEIVEVFEFIANDFLVYDKEVYNPGRVLREQECRLPNYPQNVEYADMTNIHDLELKQELLKQWKY